MPKKFITAFIFVFLFASLVYAREQKTPKQAENNADADQQISEFSLSGFGEKGKKSWDLSGKSADIFDNIIKLKDIVGNMYGEKEDVKLTADRGDFDKESGKIHVEQNVVITTSSGGRLVTDSLDWDRANEVVSTKDVVNIKKETMETTARGALGRPNLNKMALEKEVTVKISPQAPEKEELVSADNATIITCDGPLEIDYEKNIATFKNNVKVDRVDSQIYSDTMDVYFAVKKDNSGAAGKDGKDPLLMGTSIDRIVARGNVKTVRGENITYSDEAVYTALEKKVTLIGRPRLIIYSSEDFNDLMSN